jgi:WhiB family transcriptional regulator, redox-sensing transcriptional regulator
VAPTWSWDDDDWRRRHVSRGTDPDLFFPVGTTGPAIDNIKIRQGSLSSMPGPIRVPPLRLAARIEYRIWGGTSEDERRQLRRGEAGKSLAAPDPAPSTTDDDVESPCWRDARSGQGVRTDAAEETSAYEVAAAAMPPGDRYPSSLRHPAQNETSGQSGSRRNPSPVARLERLID